MDPAVPYGAFKNALVGVVPAVVPSVVDPVCGYLVAVVAHEGATVVAQAQLTEEILGLSGDCLPELLHAALEGLCHG